MKMNLMPKTVVCSICLIMVLGGAISYAAKQTLVNDDDVAIAISPSTLVMASKGGSVSVHTNIQYSTADASSLLLEGIDPYLVKADSCGYLVVKVNLDAVKDIVAAPEATLTLTGLLKDGSVIEAADTITVIE